MTSHAIKNILMISPVVYVRAAKPLVLGEKLLSMERLDHFSCLDPFNPGQ